MIAFLFPGQGSQQRGMGKGLFDEVQEYASRENSVDAMLGYSVRKLCLEDTDNRLKLTQFTQPCLYVVNALHYYRAIAQGARCDFVAGHSLGEYSALLAAGVFDFMTGLRLVLKRGELMSQAKDGSMAAVIGLEPERIEGLIRENGLATLDVANFNTPIQTVVSGSADDIRRAGPVFEKAGATMYLPLQVSAAFHSRHMASAAKAFAEFIAPLSFSAPKVPVIANVSGRPYPAMNVSASVKTLLVSQIDHSVQWHKSVSYLVDSGVDTFTEMGPGTVLTRTVQQIRQGKARATHFAAS